MPDSINTGPITPINSPLFDNQNFQPNTSSSLNVSKDTLAASQAGSSTGIVINSSRPDLTIFGFSSLVDESLQDFKESSQEFDLIADVYKDYYRNVALSALQIKERIKVLANFRETYNEYIDDLQSFVNTLTNRVQNLQNRYTNETIYPTWLSASIAAGNLINTTTTTQAQTDALINTYFANRTAYNAIANDLNGVGTNNNSRVDEINAFIAANVPGLEADRLVIQQAVEDLGIEATASIPTLSTITPYPNFGLINTAVPPPWPPNLFFDPADPRSLQPKATNPPSPGQLQNPPIGPPTFPPNVNYVVPEKLDGENYKDVYIKPLKQALDDLKRQLKKIENEIDFQEVIRVIFGQITIGEIVNEPNAQDVNAAGAGSSIALSVSGSQKGQTARLDEKFKNGELETIYNTFGIPQGSPLIANINGFSENLLQSLLLKSVTEGTNISQSGLVGASANGSPAVRAAVALSTLEGAIGFVASGVTGNAILELLLASPEFAGRSESELKELANGLAAALNLIILRTFILQVGEALGLSGLLPQVLATLGSISKDDIIKLVNGQVSYKNLFDSPIDQVLISQSLAAALKDQEAAIAIGRAIASVNRLDPFESEEAARLALRETLLDELESAGFDRETSAPIVDNALPADGAIPLSEQQILQDNLKQISFDSDLKAELLKSDFEKSEVNRIIAQAQVEAREFNTLESRAESIQATLEKEGIEKAASLVAAALQQANNPLRTPFVTEAAPRVDLTASISERTTDIFRDQGIPVDQAENQGDRLGSLLFGEGVGTIANLINLNLSEYSEAVGKSQAETADAFFKDSIRPTISTAAFLDEITNPAKVLVYASNPIFYGDAGLPRTGPAGGAPVNPIISV